MTQQLKLDANTESIDEYKTLEKQYEIERRDKLVKLGTILYPKYKGNVSSIHDFRNRWDTKTENGQYIDTEVDTLAIRVISKRAAGSKLVFYTGEYDGGKIQFMCNFKIYEDNTKFKEDNYHIHEGDIIIGHGHPGRSKSGELSLYLKTVTLLVPNMQFVPDVLADRKLRMENRWIDLNVNLDTRIPLKVRSATSWELRNYMHKLGLIEVHTPIFDLNKGGGAAKPFITHHNALKTDLYGRTAPELRLKELIVGGLPGVYELGPQLRNEEPDSTHNPEFYSLEFYIPFMDYCDLMNIAEDMLSTLVTNINGSCIIKWPNDYVVDFTPPYQKIDIYDGLEKITGVRLPYDLNTPEAEKLLKELCDRYNIITANDSYNMIKKLVELLEDQCRQPTFLINHPAIISPLARPHDDNQYITERFELFVPDPSDPETKSVELANAFTELNDPYLQKERFDQQKELLISGDDEVIEGSDTFVKALKFGMYPCAGFGMGFDRLVGILCGTTHICEVNSFTVMYKSD
jgi:lysyl-tRNA synthetase, class II